MLGFSANHNLIGIASLCLGVLIFSTQDAIIKAVSADYAVTQAIVARSVVAFPILLLFVHWEGGIRQIFSRRVWALMADASLVTVFEYTGMIWGPLWGFLFFAEVPPYTTLLGMLLILAAGLIVLVWPRSRSLQIGWI